MSKPEKKFTSGKVSAAVWVKDYEGKPSYSFTIEKNYKDKDGQWKSSGYFSKTDLHDVKELVSRILAKSVKEITPPKEDFVKENNPTNLDNEAKSIEEFLDF